VRERLAPEAVHLADEHGHAEVLEGAGVGDAAVLDPEVVHSVKVLAAEALRPEEVGVALEEGDDVVRVDLREHELLLGPDARAVGPGGAADAGVEEVAPVGSRKPSERLHVVLDVEEAAGAGPVDDLVERVALVGIAVGGRRKGNVPHGESLRRAAEAGRLLTDVLRGAAVLRGRGRGGVRCGAGGGGESRSGGGNRGEQTGGRGRMRWRRRSPWCGEPRR
jgi:hypothetical protein